MIKVAFKRGMGYKNLFLVISSISGRGEKRLEELLWSGVKGRRRNHLARWVVMRRPKMGGGLGLATLE